MYLNWANRITILRILIVPFFVTAVLYFDQAHSYLRWVALFLFIAAILTDFADGIIARKFNQKSTAGLILDPLADKILLISAFLSLFWVDSSFNVIRFPVWLIVTVISRDMILLFGAGIIYLTKKEMLVESTALGKLSSVCQAGCIIGLLMQLQFSIIFWYLTFVLTIISGLDYINRGLKIINGGVLK